MRNYLVSQNIFVKYFFKAKEFYQHHHFIFIQPYRIWAIRF